MMGGKTNLYSIEQCYGPKMTQMENYGVRGCLGDHEA